MSWKLDIKSAVAGAAVVATVAVLIGATKSEPAVGRYRLVAPGPSSAYMVDTMTGRAWYQLADPKVFFDPKVEDSK